jgi:branched-subunit amino acid aminotransferase/4-amino-4-deoxychorismate lyase
MRHAWVNGRMVAADGPSILVTDAGFRSGDGVCETVRARRGVLIEWRLHAERLRSAASLLGIPVAPTDDELADLCRALLESEGLSAVGAGRREEPGDAILTITVSRGPVDPDEFDAEPAESSSATLVIEARAYAPPSRELLAVGTSTVTSTLRRDPAWPLSGVATLSRADEVFARTAARRAGARDALFFDDEGRVADSTAGAVFVITGGDLATPRRPPAASATVRTWLLGDAAVRALGLEPIERDLRGPDLAEADEAFVASDETGIVPLAAHDGDPISTGRPGLRTIALRAAREAWLDQASRAGAEAPQSRVARVDRTDTALAAAASDPSPAPAPGPSLLEPSDFASSRHAPASGAVEIRASVAATDVSAVAGARSRLLARSAGLSPEDRRRVGPEGVFGWVTSLTSAEIVLMGRVVDDMLRTGAADRIATAFAIAWDDGVRIPNDERATMIHEFAALQVSVGSLVSGRDLRAEDDNTPRRGFLGMFGRSARESETRAFSAIDRLGSPARHGLVASWNAWVALRFRTLLPRELFALLTRPWETVVGPLPEA